MTNEQIIEKAIDEITSPTFGTTEQCLKIHKIVLKKGKPQVARIDLESKDNTAIVYFPVEEEKFNFAVYVNLEKQEVSGFGTEPYNKVYFRTYSEKFSVNELKSMTKLIPTEGWNIGDLRKHIPGKYAFSSIEFMPNPEPDEFDDKLTKLLDFLEQDREGIKKLIENASGYIQVVMIFYNGNGCLGGPAINKENIRRMSELGLDIDFDLYAFGNNFID